MSLNDFYDKEYFEGGKSNYQGYEWKHQKGNWTKYAGEIKQFLNPRNAVDLGCAKGFFVHAMREQGIEAKGIDVSEYAIQHAYGLSKGHIVQGDFASGAITFRGFDLVTCMDVIEHIPEGEALDSFVSGIRESLNIGGYALIRTVFYRHPKDTDPTHVTIQPREWWVSGFAQFGLDYADAKFAEMFDQDGVADVNTMLFIRNK